MSDTFRTAKKAVGMLFLAALLAGTIAESLWGWPNYLAFFNQLVGGSRSGFVQQLRVERQVPIVPIITAN
jgi:hypothetical protein